MIRLVHLWLALPLLLTACASSGPYRALRSDYEQGRFPSYYQAQLAPTVTPAPAPSTAAWLTEAEAQIDLLRQRWESVLAASSEVPPVVDLLPGDPGRYRSLAADPTLGDRLAAGIDLTTLTGLLLELNPMIRAARTGLRATLEQFPQATYLDALLQQYNAFAKQLETQVGPAQQMSMQAMSFPYPDVLALKGRLVNEEAEIARRAEAIAVRDAITALRLAYYDLLFVNQSIAVYDEMQALVQQSIEVAQARLRADEGMYDEVVMAQIELSRLGNDVQTMRQERETVLAKLNQLLARPPEAPLGPPQPVADRSLAAGLDRLYLAAVEHRQELQQMRLRIATMHTMVEMSRRMTYPDPSLGASFFDERARLSSGTGGASPPAMGGGGDGAPQPFMTQPGLNPRDASLTAPRGAYIREVELRAEAMAGELAGLEDEARLAVKEAHTALDTAWRRIALYRQSLLPQARQSLETTAASYRSGRAGFLTFLEAERTLLRFRLEEQGAWRDYRRQFATLEQAVGGALPSTLLPNDLTPTPDK